MTTAEHPAPHTILTGRRLLLAAIALSFGNFMVILDLTIANVSVPHIAGELGISLDQGTWIITSYAVAEAICVPLTGWLARRFGSVRVFAAALVGFGLFSLFCGLAANLGLLVACRVGQGLCGAPIMPMSQSLIVRIFPPDKRATAIGYWGMTVMVAPALGPILGGLISDTISWHWIFLVNVPIAAALTVAIWALLRPVETPTERVPIDRVGLALLVFWITCLQIMLDIGRDRDWFGDPLIVALAIGAGIGFCAFVIWELTEEHPVVDLSIFRYRAYTFAVVPFGLAYGAMFSVVVIVPQWLQATLGYSAFAAGTVTAFQAISGFFMSALVGRVAGRFDLRYLMSAGILWMGLVALLRAVTWSTAAGYMDFALPMFLVGLGIPLMAVPLTTLSLSAVPPEKIASAAGLQTFVRTVALAVSTSVAVSYWGNFEQSSRSALVSVMHPDQTSATLRSLGFNLDAIRAYIAMTVEQQANTIAMNRLFAFSAAVSFFAAFLVPFGPRPKKPAAH